MALEISLTDRPGHTVRVTRLGARALLRIDGRDHDATWAGSASGRGLLTLGTRTESVHVVVDGDSAWVHAFGRAWELSLVDTVQRALSGAASSDTALAPMPGTVIKVAVAAGEAVADGQELVVIESMKMQSEIVAPRAGVVERVFVAVGDTFDRGAPLVSLVAQDLPEVAPGPQDAD